MCKHNNYHKILSFHKYKKKSFNRSHNNQRTIKESAKEKGGLDLGELSFNSGAFFSSLVKMSKQDIDSFLSFFPQLPRILEIARQAAIEEKRRRKFEVAIAKFRMERRMKYKRIIEGEEKKDKKKRKRLNRLTAAPALEGSSSQAMDQSS